MRMRLWLQKKSRYWPHWMRAWLWRRRQRKNVIGVKIDLTSTLMRDHVIESYNEWLHDWVASLRHYYVALDPMIHSLRWVQAQRPLRHEWIEDVWPDVTPRDPCPYFGYSTNPDIVPPQKMDCIYSLGHAGQHWLDNASFPEPAYRVKTKEEAPAPSPRPLPYTCRD